jgi:uncharacterized protein YodC (DUF2158 family)
MENKINIAELLKDCPIGMELDCTMYEDVYLDYIDELNIIHCYIQRETYKTSITFNQYGTPNSDIKSKCVIFPKGKTTWEGFIPPCQFKVGDIIQVEDGYKVKITEVNIEDECYGYESMIAKGIGSISFSEQDNWELVPKIKPKFKVGDKVRVKNGVSEPRIIDGVFDTFYSLQMLGKIDFTDQDNWELVPNKFDIITLKPFESRVLVRNVDGDLWKPAIYGFPHSKGCYVVGGVYWGQCIPYEENKELLGTTSNPEEYGSR